jgi:aquaporin Z
MSPAVAIAGLGAVIIMTSTIRWRIYAIEAALLGAFMVSASLFTLLLEHPTSSVVHAVPSPFIRRALIGLGMGTTAIGLIYSPWGRRSGAHLNPAVTISNVRLGKLTGWDAALYIAAQFAGGIAGMIASVLITRSAVGHPSVNFVATLPGAYGLRAAWTGEFLITFVLMTTLLCVNRHPSLAPWSGYFAGALVALYITFEAPISGMSMNPARTFASALAGHIWTGLWIYFTAPVLGMLAAVEFQRRLSREPHHLCCKLSHCPRIPCVIPCNCTAHVAHPTGHAIVAQPL